MRHAYLRGSHRWHAFVARRRAPGAHPVPDLVRREFMAAAPDNLWAADLTYVPTREGVLYLAVVLDVFSRRMVGWAMAAHQLHSPFRPRQPVHLRGHA